MKYYIIAGEASGDMHAANLMEQLRLRDPGAVFRCWGGDRMKAMGGELVKHYRELAFMGFTEVVMNLRTILRNMKACKEDMERWKPDAVILVDYPGFNLRIADFAREKGYRVYYYISPQVWAWKASRVEKIRKTVDKMYVILPFEKPFYEKFGYAVEFVGHPLLDEISKHNAGAKTKDTGGEPLVALLPGSRRQEVETMLPLMLSVIPQFPNCRFAVGMAASLPEEFYRQLISGSKVELAGTGTYELLSRSQAALVTSGTATLETALFGVPEVVCYKGGRISYLIARSLVKVPFISLVNLVMEREVVKELIQDELNSKALVRELKRILYDSAARETLLRDYEELRQRLGGAGASEHAATSMVEDLRSVKG